MAILWRSKRLIKASSNGVSNIPINRVRLLGKDLIQGKSVYNPSETYIKGPGLIISKSLEKLI